MKKKYLLIILSVAIVAVAAIGGTMASKYDDGASMTATISEKTLGVKAEGKKMDTIIAVPGSENEVSYYVKNDGGASNGTLTENGSSDIYARVNLFFEWKQDDNSKVKYGEIDQKLDYCTMYLNTGNSEAPSYVSVPKKDEDNNQVYIASYNEQIKIGDWIITYYDNEQMVMYYTKPIKKNQLSSEYLSKIAFDTAMDNKYVDATLSVFADVNAIQVNSADAAFATEWGVYPRFVEDANGVKIIDAVSENAE